MELGNKAREYKMRSFLPFIPPDNLQTRRPMLAFPRGNVYIGPRRIRPPSGATRTSIGFLQPRSGSTGRETELSRLG